jgi:hypothetical protein
MNYEFISLFETALCAQNSKSNNYIPESKTLRYLCALITCSKAIAAAQIYTLKLLKTRLEN